MTKLKEFLEHKVNFYKEAIEQCKQELLTSDKDAEFIINSLRYYEAMLERYKKLLELVDKETPKKVRDLSNGYRLQVECPSCGETLINENECINNEFHNRCHECGQKLDWSDE